MYRICKHVLRSTYAAFSCNFIVFWLHQNIRNFVYLSWIYTHSWKILCMNNWQTFTFLSTVSLKNGPYLKIMWFYSLCTPYNSLHVLSSNLGLLHTIEVPNHVNIWRCNSKYTLATCFWLLLVIPVISRSAVWFDLFHILLTKTYVSSLFKLKVTILNNGASCKTWHSFCCSPRNCIIDFMLVCSKLNK